MQVISTHNNHFTCLPDSSKRRAEKIHRKNKQRLRDFRMNNLLWEPALMSDLFKKGKFQDIKKKWEEYRDREDNQLILEPAQIVEEPEPAQIVEELEPEQITEIQWIQKKILPKTPEEMRRDNFPNKTDVCEKFNVVYSDFYLGVILKKQNFTKQNFKIEYFEERANGIQGCLIREEQGVTSFVPEYAGSRRRNSIKIAGTWYVPEYTDQEAIEYYVKKDGTRGLVKREEKYVLSELLVTEYPNIEDECNIPDLDEKENSFEIDFEEDFFLSDDEYDL